MTPHAVLVVCAALVATVGAAAPAFVPNAVQADCGLRACDCCLSSNDYLQCTFTQVLLDANNKCFAKDNSVSSKCTQQYCCNRMCDQALPRAGMGGCAVGGKPAVCKGDGGASSDAAMAQKRKAQAASTKKKQVHDQLFSTATSIIAILLMSVPLGYSLFVLSKSAALLSEVNQIWYARGYGQKRKELFPFRRSSRRQNLLEPGQESSEGAAGAEVAQEDASPDGGNAFSADATSLDVQPVTISLAYIDYRVDDNSFSPEFADRLRNAPVPRKQIMFDVCCRFPPGTFTAIMGPSGSGKTTLLNLISGRAREGELSGLRMVNGRPCGMLEYERFMRQQGYVLQGDCFYEDLSVRDTLLFSSMLGLDETIPIASKVERIDRVLQEVGMSHVASTPVGGIHRSGISGGQKRRLSIAVELLRMPSVLLLDEPTSGLDATTSLKLCESLHGLATHANRTVITVLHQPRSEIFDHIDQLVLLGEGGKVVYAGPTAGAQAALAASTGMDPSKYSNPGDFIIDCVGLDPEADDHRNENGSKEQRVGKMVTDYQASAHYHEEIQNLKQEYENPGDDNLKMVTTSFANQVWVLFARKWCRFTLTPSAIIGAFIGYSAVVVVLGLSLSYTQDGKEDIRQRAYQNMMFWFMISAFATVIPYLTLVPEYFEERGVLAKENDAGICRLSTYILSCLLSEVPRAVLWTSWLLVLGYAMLPLNTDSYSYILFSVVCLTVCVCAWQSLVCLLCFTTDDVDPVWGYCFMFLGASTLLGGVMIPKENLPGWEYLPWGKMCYYTGIPAAGVRCMLVNEFQGSHLNIACADFFADSSRQAASSSTGLSFSQMASAGSLGGGLLNPKNSQLLLKNGLCGKDDLAVIDMGTVWMRQLELTDVNQYEEMFMLLVASLLVRVLAWGVAEWRELRSRQLTAPEAAAVAAGQRLRQHSSPVPMTDLTPPAL